MSHFNLTLIDDESMPAFSSPLYAAENFTALRIETSKSITGQARNLGVYWAEKFWGRGDYLYLSDNDVYFTPGWLDTLITFFNSHAPDFKLLGGWNHPFLQPHATRDGFLRGHDAVAGASQLMQWSTWDTHGPLDAHAIGVGQSEDWKFCQDIIQGGGRVGSVYPRVVLNCGVTNSFGAASLGADVMLKELTAAAKFYKDLIWE